MSKNALAGFKQFEKPAVSRTTLRRGQAALYDLLAAKNKNKTTVTFEEAKHIWLTKVCRNNYGGVPHRYDYFHERIEKGDEVSWNGAYVPMTKIEINMAVMDWLVRTIGVLVMRGYLKVIPMVELV